MLMLLFYCTILDFVIAPEELYERSWAGPIVVCIYYSALL